MTPLDTSRRLTSLPFGLPLLGVRPATKAPDGAKTEPPRDEPLLADDDVIDVEAEAGALVRQSDAVLDRLDRDLVGLSLVKSRLRQLADLLVVQCLRLRFGITSRRPTLNMCFTGNPGTGKTTVAKQMAELLHDLGYLPANHLVVASREDLVGQYVGHTAPKTREVIKRAMGGLLFIDEAYSLHRPASQRDFGQEAIEVLLEAMDADRDQLIVILAGYKDKMHDFFRANPGMASRVPHRIDFADYGLHELMAIAELMLGESGYRFSGAAQEALRSYLAQVMRQPGFANGRSVRNILERSQLHHASRVLRAAPRLKKEDLVLIAAADIAADEETPPAGGHDLHG